MRSPILTGSDDMKHRAEVKATYQALGGYIEMGGYARAAHSARALADLLDDMAKRDKQADQAGEPRARVRSVPPRTPVSRPAEVRLAGHRYEYTRVVPELPDGHR